MGITSRHQLIKRLQADVPRGAPFDLGVLGRVGVSPQLAAKYVGGGWLVRLAHGVYAFPNDELGAYPAIRFLQTRVQGLHVGGGTGLAMQGVRHNLTAKQVLVLWGDDRATLPPWFLERFPARYVNACLFAWPDSGLAASTLHSPPGAPAGLRVAVPERALIEMLYEAGVRQGLEEARNLFDGIRTPRKDVLGRLLSCCTSVKAVRLFLTWARETGLVDVDELLEQYRICTGSDRRWISRLDDGSILSLKPHGEPIR